MKVRNSPWVLSALNGPNPTGAYHISSFSGQREVYLAKNSHKLLKPFIEATTGVRQR